MKFVNAYPTRHRKYGCFNNEMEEKIYVANDFIEFHAPTGRSTPLATLDAFGKLYLSAAVTKTYEIDIEKHRWVKLYYNESANVIALKLITEKIDGALDLKGGAGGGLFINSKSFTTRYNMMTKDRLKETYVGKYYVEKTEINGLGEVFLINLQEKRP